MATATGKTQAEIDAIIIALTLQWQYTLRQRQGQLSPAASARAYTDNDARLLASRFSRPSASPQSPHLIQTLHHLSDEIDRYESPTLHEKALDLIPFDRLHDRAAALAETGAFAHLDFQDHLAQALVEWAKKDFLEWVDPVKCDECGGDTSGLAGGSPTVDEREQGGAGRVELYECNASHQHITRFPRYTKLEKLLETRKGRCGEFAAIFMLLLRALGFRARYIWNSEDHVWNEYFSERLKRWVHLDSCEGARDKNLLYDLGWGKKMRYCVAFSSEGAIDVTRTYVSDWISTLARRHAATEGSLAQTLLSITSARRMSIGIDDQERLAEEDILEEAWQQNSKARFGAVESTKLEGRTSGTKAWREQRSEAGDQSQASKPPLTATRLLAKKGTSRPTMNGSAAPGPDAIHLTSDKTDQVGSAFLALPPEVGALVVSFTFRISKPGADGFALVIHSAPSGLQTLGQGGCELGYGGIPSSIAIEIDTYRSQDRCDDPPVPHISVHTRGAQPNEAHHRSSLWCTRPGALPDIDDNREYCMRVEVSEYLRIWFTESGKEWVELTGQALDIPKIAWTYLGWTASTGGISQSHQITDFEVWEGIEQADVAKNTTESTPSVP